MMPYLLLFLMMFARLACAQKALGVELFNKQDWPGAAKAFQTAVAEDPKDGASWFRLGTSLYRMEKYDESVAAYEKASSAGFQPMQALAAAGRSWAARGDAVKAAAFVERAAQGGWPGLAFLDTDPGFAKVRSDPAFIAARAKVDANAHPCMNDPRYHQFDYWLGEWDVEVGGTRVAASRIERMLDGCVIQENWMPSGGNEGKSWNFFNASTGKWEQVWVSMGNVLKLEGELRAGVMTYTGTRKQGGQEVMTILTFAPLSEGRVRQVWNQSTDSGKTWSNAFDGIYIPKKKP